MTEQMWDERYAAPRRVWSGEPNAWLVAVAAELEPGTALDLGCGEGADAIWLAAHGWRVTAVDFSAAGLARARSGAEGAGVDVTWVRADLGSWTPAATFDLVSAQFFHGPVDVRRRVHRMAWRATAGTLVVVGHALDHPGGPPPDVRYGAADVLASVGVPAGDARVVAADRRERGDARDCVVVLRR